MLDSEKHKGNVTAVFDLVAPGYDLPALRFFPFCADRLVNFVRPVPGSKVLDVATGTGVVAVAMGQAVGPEGRVHAIDLSSNMVDKAEANVRKMALDNVDFHIMDAEQLEFRQNYFHSVVCSFGLFFIPDMVKALTDWVRVARPGGRVVFSTFTEQAFEPMKSMFLQQLQEFGGSLPPDDDNSPSLRRLQSPGQCEAIMQRAGLENIAVETLQLGYHLASADDWWEVIWNAAFRGMLASIPEQNQAAFQHAHKAAIAELAGDNGIWMDVEVMVSVGEKPT